VATGRYRRESLWQLKHYYKTDFKLPEKHASEISKPDIELQKLTKGTTKKAYHKVRHAVELLSKLNVEKLKNDFPDVKNLIDALKKA
jgi:hypothetical protein